MFSTKSGHNWPRSSGEKYANVKKNQTIDRRKTDKGQQATRKAHSSGEL